MNDTVVIVGAGHAAGQAVISLRQGGHTGPITVIGEEPHPPYQRPPLSKKFLAGELAQQRLYLKPPDWYAQHGVTLMTGVRVARLDLRADAVELDDGRRLGWDRLLLTTGSRARHMPAPGIDLPGVHCLRTIADVVAIRDGVRPGGRLAVVGGGYIGLEVAAVARQCGMEVVVLEMADRVMPRVVCAEMSAFYHAVHAAAGVQIRLRTAARAFSGDSRVREVVTDTDERLPVDLVVVGIGIEPVTELAQDAGLACDDGILVDELARTSEPRVLAAGDCTRHPNALLGRRLRLESVHNALEQARTAAATICGEQRPYNQIPWFWSDQYDLKLQIAGLGEGHDSIVIRGDPAERRFSACYLSGGYLMAVDAVNSPRDFIQARELIAGRARMDAQRLADPSIALQDACAA